MEIQLDLEIDKKLCEMVNQFGYYGYRNSFMETFDRKYWKNIWRKESDWVILTQNKYYI